MNIYACVLSKGSPKPKWTKIDVDDDAAQVTEFTANEPTFKQAKSRVHPASITGVNPRGYASDRILELLGDGWSIQKEDPRFSEDRLSFQLPFTDNSKLLAVLEVITGKAASKINLSDWQPVLHERILCTQASPSEITLVMVPSTCSEAVATRISVAMRCMSGEASVYDFNSEPIKAEPMLKLHRRYESLSDTVLEKFANLGVMLRSATFNGLSGHGAFVGF